MTPQELSLATGARIDRARENLHHVDLAMHDFEINTVDRQAAFLAQIGHESGVCTGSMRYGGRQPHSLGTRGGSTWAMRRQVTGFGTVVAGGYR